MANQEPVKLPREVAEALEKAKEDFPDMPEQVAWCIPDEETVEFYGEHWRVVFSYAEANPGGFFQLIDALRYGYVIDEPIRVEITTEQQEKIRRYYESISKDDEESEEFKRGEQLGFREAYDLAGIKIPGVNE